VETPEAAVLTSVPQHLGIIPDGNRRWARERGLPTAAGFQAAARRAPQVLPWCADQGIGHVTLWFMSRANLSRSAAETEAMLAITDQLVRELTGLGRWRLRAIGRLDLLPPAFQAMLAESARRTERVDGPRLNLAIGYSGREDILGAVRTLLESADARTRPGGQIAEALTAESIDRHLSTGGQPPVDLVLRTSGEMRLSDFMIWQLADAELFFSRTLWPDFAEADFAELLAAFRTRDRRFGL
jgi:short-chain Z-isoprenyl diphosphate synthase